MARPSGCSGSQASGWNCVPHHGRSGAATASTRHVRSSRATEARAATRSPRPRGSRRRRSTRAAGEEIRIVEHLDGREAPRFPSGGARRCRPTARTIICMPAQIPSTGPGKPAEHVVEPFQVHPAMHRPRIGRAGEDQSVCGHRVHPPVRLGLHHRSRQGGDPRADGLVRHVPFGSDPFLMLRDDEQNAHARGGGTRPVSARRHGARSCDAPRTQPGALRSQRRAPAARTGRERPARPVLRADRP